MDVVESYTGRVCRRLLEDRPRFHAYGQYVLGQSGVRFERILSTGDMGCGPPHATRPRKQGQELTKMPITRIHLTHYKFPRALFNQFHHVPVCLLLMCLRLNRLISSRAREP
jgi:hypothetical protein